MCVCVLLWYGLLHRGLGSSARGFKNTPERHIYLSTVYHSSHVSHYGNIFTAPPAPPEAPPPLWEEEPPTGSRPCSWVGEGREAPDKGGGWRKRCSGGGAQAGALTRCHTRGEQSLPRLDVTADRKSTFEPTSLQPSHVFPCILLWKSQQENMNLKSRLRKEIWILITDGLFCSLWRCLLKYGLTPTLTMTY